MNLTPTEIRALRAYAAGQPANAPIPVIAKLTDAGLISHTGITDAGRAALRADLEAAWGDPSTDNVAPGLEPPTL